MIGVEYQVQDRLLEQVDINQAQRQLGREVRADHDPPGRRVGLVKVAEFVDDRVQIGRLQSQLLNPGEPEKVFDDIAQPLNLVLQPLDPLKDAAVARCLGLLKVLGQEIEIQGDRRERISNLVSQAAGQLGNLRVLGSSRLVISGSSLGGR